LCQGGQTTKTDLEDTCLGAYYLERWSLMAKLCKLKFIPGKEHVFMIATKKGIISSPAPFSTFLTTFNFKFFPNFYKF
jgi:hypothetical protein